MVQRKEFWDEMFRSGRYQRNPAPPTALQEYIEVFPKGKALDIATGTGRLSVFLGQHGYEVDAIDQSREGLQIARQNARDRGVDDRINWIQVNANDFRYPVDTYNVITARSFRVIDRLTEIKNALKPDGMLFHQDHVRTPDSFTTGPSDDRYRVGVNEILRACTDLTVLHYKEFSTDGDAYSQLIARKSTGTEQSLPPRSLYRD